MSTSVGLGFSPSFLNNLLLLGWEHFWSFLEKKGAEEAPTKQLVLKTHQGVQEQSQDTCS